MRTLLRRFVGGAAVVLASAALTLPVLTSVSASAAETPAPAGGQVAISPTSAAPGDKVSVWTSGWAPGTQLQAVVCGQLAVGGSNTCHLPSAVTAASNVDGEASHSLTLARPPKACPCVIRVTTFTAPALAVNVPVDVQGHRMKVVPQQEEASYDLRVDDVALDGRGGIASLLGLGGSTTMTVTLANRGDQTVQAPPIMYGFGRGQVEPETELDPQVRVPAGGEAKVEVDLEIPMLAFGSHRAVAQWADGSGSVAGAGISVYPVGALLLLIVALLGAVVFDLRRTGTGRLEELLSSTPGAHRFIDDEGSYPLPDVVYVEEIGGYLVKPTVLKSSRVTRRLTGRVSVDDLAALVEKGGIAAFADGTPAASAPIGAGGMLATLLRGDRHRDGGRGSGGSFGSGPGLSFLIRSERKNNGDGPSDGSGHSMGSGPGLSFFVRNDRENEGGRHSGRSGGSGPGLSFFVRPDRDRDA